MVDPVSPLVLLVSGGVLLAQLLLVGLLLLYLFTNKNPIVFFPRFIQVHLIPLAFLFTLVVAGMTLYFEYSVGYLPCDLCWWQRIFFFPQILLLGLASLRRDRGIVDYSLMLSGVGLLVGILNYALLFVPSLAPCSAAGVACSKVYFLVFGYMTFPLWSVTSFLVLIALMLMERGRTVEES